MAEQSHAKLGGLETLQKEYADFKSKGYKLNMARGKPAATQLDLANPLLQLVDAASCKSEAGIDVRNYGELTGLKECRQLLAAMMNFPLENVIVAGCSSLTVMYDCNTRLLLTTPPGGSSPWFNLPQRKVICLVPGYDRHFQMSAGLGFELISVPLTADGPCLEELKALVASDPTIKALWCVPYYSNPTGICYSAQVCQELAAMPCAAPDFRIFWDMAYSVHHLYPDQRVDPNAAATPNEAPPPACPTLPNMLELCAQAGHPDRVLAFASTSKITFAGGGVAALAASPTNLAWFQEQMQLQMICTDKVNQLRHARFLPDLAAVKAHMTAEADLLRPKFEAFLSIMDRELADCPGVSYSRPRGGYFIALYLPPRTATRIVSLAKEAGLVLTAAGCTHPYNHDPDDAFIRIAPSFPSVSEIKDAAALLCCCIKLALAEHA